MLLVKGAGGRDLLRETLTVTRRPGPHRSKSIAAAVSRPTAGGAVAAARGARARSATLSSPSRAQTCSRRCCSSSTRTMRRCCARRRCWCRAHAWSRPRASCGWTGPIVQAATAEDDAMLRALQACVRGSRAARVIACAARPCVRCAAASSRFHDDRNRIPHDRRLVPPHGQWREPDVVRVCGAGVAARALRALALRPVRRTHRPAAHAAGRGPYDAGPARRAARDGDRPARPVERRSCAARSAACAKCRRRSANSARPSPSCGHAPRRRSARGCVPRRSTCSNSARVDCVSSTTCRRRSPRWNRPTPGSRRSTTRPWPRSARSSRASSTALRSVDVPDLPNVISRLTALEAAVEHFRVLGVPVAKARRGGQDAPRHARRVRTRA